jgi:subtilase family serine protease
VDLENLVTLRGNTHPLARAEYDQGAAPDSLPMERMLLVLLRSTEQETALRKLLDEQQIKSSPNFHIWLTPEQLGEQFGPVAADIQAVTDWLGSQGFEVSRVAAGRTVIEFTGTAGAVRQALHTEIHKFTVNGEEHWANANDPQIPAALAPVVAGFASLNNFPKKPLTHSLGTFRRTKLTGEVQPLFTYGEPCNSGADTCYYFAVGPADFATIYNVAPLWSAGTDGTGQTIAVVGETNINPQDVADFRVMFGLPVNPPNIILNGPDPGINGDETESDLDVQWSGAVAKGATIDFVVSESTESTSGIDLSALYIIDNNLAPIMSESYGACEAYLGTGGNLFYNTLW